MITPHALAARAAQIKGSYTLPELTRLAQFAVALEERKQDAHVVEIGVEFGRSSSIFLQISDVTPHYRVTFIDSRGWSAEDGRASFAELESQYVLSRHVFYEMTSKDAAEFVPSGIDLLHIDADHTESGVRTDLELYLPKLNTDGVVVLHDYGCYSFPGYSEEIDRWFKGSEWLSLGVVETQIAFKRRD